MSRRLPFLLLAVGVLLAPVGAHANSSVESGIFAKINAGRSQKLVWHSGLQSAAWGHSRVMARTGGLNHNGAAARVAGAQPDPYETNGAPDDGNNGDWCENVAYTNWGTGEEAIDTLYKAWKKSAPHNRCMQDTDQDVGAVGVYYENGTWWATFIAMVDKTPPGGAPAPTKATKAEAPRKIAPAPQAADPKPAATARPVSSAPPAAAGEAPPVTSALAASDMSTPRPSGFGDDPTPVPTPVVDQRPVPLAAPVVGPTSSRSSSAPQAAGVAGIVVLGGGLAIWRLRRPRLLRATGETFVWNDDL